MKISLTMRRSKLKKYTSKKKENIVTKVTKSKMQRKVIEFSLLIFVIVSSCKIQLYNLQKPEIIRRGADYLGWTPRPAGNPESQLSPIEETNEGTIF